MKVLMILIAMFIGLSLSAEYVTSPLDEVRIIYLAAEGSTVKEGEALYKLDDWFQKNEILRAEVDIELEKANVEDKKSDIERAKKLHEKKAISLAAYEDIIVEYYKAEYELIKAKLALKQLESSLGDYVCSAPYDCKIIKNFLCINSGTEVSTKIMEIEPVK